MACADATAPVALVVSPAEIRVEHREVEHKKTASCPY
jgi:hypothetical protein